MGRRVRNKYMNSTTISAYSKSVGLRLGQATDIFRGREDRIRVRGAVLSPSKRVKFGCYEREKRKLQAEDRKFRCQ